MISRALPAAEGVYLDQDLVLAMLATVVDYQMHSRAVVNAMERFKRRNSGRPTTLDELVSLLSRYPDDKEGNIALALEMWGYRFWTRAAQLRRLVEYFDSVGVSDLSSLQAWASTSTFDDFRRRVHGLGPAVYQWLVMRQGVDTVKPDVHVRRFAERAVGRRLSDEDVVEVITRAAQLLGRKAHEVDWASWEWSLRTSQ